MSANQTKSNKMTTKQHIILFAGALLCTLLWGSAFPALKVGFEYFQIPNSDIGSQMVFAGIRFFTAGIIVLIIGSIQSKTILIPGLYNRSTYNAEATGLPFSKYSKKLWFNVVILALTQTFLQYMAYYMGLANIAGSRGALFNSLGTILTIVFGMIVFKSPTTVRKNVGIIIGFLGVIYVCVGNVGGDFSLLGDGCMILSSIFAAAGNIINKHSTKGVSPFLVTGWHLGLGGFLLLLLGLILGGSFTVTSFNALLILAYLIFISACAFTVWSALLKHFPIENVSMYRFLIPLFGSLLSCFFLGESLSISMLIALALVSVGIILVQK